MRKKFETPIIGTLCVLALVLWCWMIGTAATTIKESVAVPVTLVKPALPKAVRHEEFYGTGAAPEADAFVAKCVRDGYIIKTVATSTWGDGGHQVYYVIAEKY